MNVIIAIIKAKIKIKILRFTIVIKYLHLILKNTCKYVEIVKIKRGKHVVFLFNKIKKM